MIISVTFKVLSLNGGGAFITEPIAYTEIVVLLILGIAFLSWPRQPIVRVVCGFLFVFLGVLSLSNLVSGHDCECFGKFRFSNPTWSVFVFDAVISIGLLSKGLSRSRLLCIAMTIALGITYPSIQDRLTKLFSGSISEAVQLKTCTEGFEGEFAIEAQSQKIEVIGVSAGCPCIQISPARTVIEPYEKCSFSVRTDRDPGKDSIVKVFLAGQRTRVISLVFEE